MLQLNRLWSHSEKKKKKKIQMTPKLINKIKLIKSILGYITANTSGLF